MPKVKPGEVIRLREGLKVYHHQVAQVNTLIHETVVVVEHVRDTAVGSEDDHFEPCFMVEGRVLNTDLTYAPEGALLTFAQFGDFREEFIQADCPVIKVMQKTFV